MAIAVVKRCRTCEGWAKVQDKISDKGSGPRFSVVTISFNQCPFLGQTVDSVLAQRAEGHDVQYIVCDPGSTDGSRELVESRGSAVDIKLFEPDGGPADGLNRGFARADGDIFCYINSDDYFLPGAFGRIAAFMAAHPDVDVVTGHGIVIDQNDRKLRRVWSEPYTRVSAAFGSHIQVQPGTFIRAAAFRKSGGFDADDRCTWDATLLDRLYLSGARFAVLDACLGTYRLHPGSITMSGSLRDKMHQSALQRFRILMGRDQRPVDRFTAQILRLAKHLRWPGRAIERWRYGPLFMREA